MEWIELSIKCRLDDERTSALRDLDIDIPEETEYRPLLLKIDAIEGIYPNVDGTCFIFIRGGEELSILESYDHVKEAIKQLSK